jgi:hypothetical protein
VTTCERKQLWQWIELARADGWTVITDSGNHFKWLPRDGGQVIITPATPGGGNRSIDNVRAKLRRGGLKIPRK